MKVAQRLSSWLYSDRPWPGVKRLPDIWLESAVLRLRLRKLAKTGVRQLRTRQGIGYAALAATIPGVIATALIKGDWMFHPDPNEPVGPEYGPYFSFMLGCICLRRSQPLAEGLKFFAGIPGRALLAASMWLLYAELWLETAAEEENYLLKRWVYLQLWLEGTGERQAVMLARLAGYRPKLGSETPRRSATLPA